MYYINKIIGVLVSPTVGLSVACLVCAGVGFWKAGKLGRWGKVGFWIAAALLWMWMTAMPGRILGLPLEREWLVDGEIPAAESFPAADAIVCLGGGMGVATNEVHAANMCPASDRVWMAARLWKVGKAPKIICTGPTCAASTRGLLRDLGVPGEATVFLDKPRNTEEEAKGIVRLFGDEVKVKGEGEQRNCSILLVTSAWHMRRAKFMFEKYAPQIRIVPAPTDFEATIGFDGGFSIRELLPGSAFMNENYLREWIGYVGYRVMR